MLAMPIVEVVNLPNAKAVITHCRPKEFIDGKAAYRDETGALVPGYKWLDFEGGTLDPSTVDVLSVEETSNVKTNSGMDFIHTQAYGSSGLGANGLNYIGLSNDTVTETSASTTLSNEIAANGLSRAQGTVAHTAGAATTTVQRTFTASGPQAAQKAALFTASSAGVMNHVLPFTQRSLQTADTLQITYTITIT